ncbi:CBS domain-containing protein [soil metagenome]
MRARDVMSNPVTTIGTNATLLEAAKLLVNMKIGALPVVDERSVMVGIVSEADLIRRMIGDTADPTPANTTHTHPAPAPQPSLNDAAAKKALSSSITEIMTSPVITATEDTALEEVAGLMLKSRTKRIPILRGDAMVGIVSRIDLVKAMLSQTLDAGALQAGPPDEESLRREVEAAIERLGIPLGAAFDVVVRHGVAHLWGRLSSEQANQACQAAAAQVPGIVGVMSHMQILRSQR